MYQSFNAEGYFVWWMRKYIEKARKIDRGLDMILNKSDLRRLVRSMLVEGVVNDSIKRACGKCMMVEVILISSRWTLLLT